MKLEKLTPELVSGIIDAGFDKEPREIQSTCIPKIKSGADLFIIAPEGVGKSTCIVIGVIQQLKKAFEEAPRALVMAATKEKAYQLEDQFKLLGKHTNLRTFTVFDHGKIQFQKDTIYDGLDILIGTPKRLNELISITGIPLTKIKMFAVDDADTFIPGSSIQIIYRIADNIEKAQFLIAANSWSEKFDKLSVRMMKNPSIVKVD
jgi:ATP-dependent RNA helicase RhlE